MKSNPFQRYLLAGFVFKSALIGGGYATGRELVEFFLSKGPVTGFLGMIVAAAIFSLILAVTFEVARRFSLYDYRALMQRLLGPAWIAYEAAFLALLILVLSVLGAAAGEIASKQFGAPPIVGAGVLTVLVATVVFFGTKAVERFFTGWTVVLYGAFIVFFVWSAKTLGHDIAVRWQATTPTSGALTSGLIYAGYSLAIVPTVVYCARHFTRPRDAIVSGLIAGPVAMIPAALFFLVMVARYPEVNREPVPILFMIAQLGSPVFRIVFQVVIFGTLVEAGSALIHGFNERIADMMTARGAIMPKWARAAIALGLLVCSIYLATTIGIVDLVAKGYGYSTWVFLGLVAVPMLTRGLWLITRRRTAVLEEADA
ncbi:MAG TPA: hypothetical protein VG407_09925 [Caulobacteraceae bacterium]|nr:hypothetical protein [Caulobacteraceae bacterium]